LKDFDIRPLMAVFINPPERNW